MPRFFGMTFEELFSAEDVFTDDLRKSALTPNPTLIPDIDLVYVLSGRSTALGADADKLDRPFDSFDDIERMREGVRIATQINALRAHKKPDELTSEEWVTPILYNGRAIHNKHLKEALEQGLIAYPKELFTILDIHPENTIGQIQSFKKYLADSRHKNVAVVSSAYHIPRVARTIGSESPQVYSEEDDSTLSELNLFLFGVHKQDKRNGIANDLQGEYRAMRSYSGGDKPSIARLQSNNTFFNDIDLSITKSFNRARFWHSVIARPASKTCLFTIKNTNTVGVLRLIQRPEHVEHEVARIVLQESFISEYEKYLLPHDIDPKLTLWRRGDDSVAHYYGEYFKTEFGDFLSGKLDYWVEARIEGKLVGWATFERERLNHDAVYMNLLVVHPAYQGKAVGYNLVMSLIKLGIIPNLNAIHLLLRKKNEGGRAFYSKLGFEIDPLYEREDNFVNLDLLEALTWKNPELQCVKQQEEASLLSIQFS